MTKVILNQKDSCTVSCIAFSWDNISMRAVQNELAGHVFETLVENQGLYCHDDERKSVPYLVTTGGSSVRI